MFALTCIDIPVAIALSTLLLSFVLSSFHLLRMVSVRGRSHE